MTITPETRHLVVAPPLLWGEESVFKRGPILSLDRQGALHNVIGAYGGQYAHYRAAAAAADRISEEHKPDYTNTIPSLARDIAQNQHWSGRNCIASFDPFGHMVAENFAGLISEGYNVRPTIAITPARLNIPEIHSAVTAKRLRPDGSFLTKDGRINVTKIAIEPVWHLSGIANYYGTDEGAFRKGLFYGLGGSHEALLNKPGLKVYLPAHGETTVYVVGDMNKLWDPNTILAARTHDKCGSSDTHGANICSCRPALIWGYEQAIVAAQNGGVGLIVYTEAEGRGHGVVPKNLTYNARIAGPDLPSDYANATARIAGLADLREQMIATDVYRWLGISKVDVWCSGSPFKTEAMKAAGIEIGEERSLPTNLLDPDTARVEVLAKIGLGYNYRGYGEPAQPRRLITWARSALAGALRK